MNRILAGCIALLLITACKEQKNEAAKTADVRAVANETEKNIYRAGDSMLAAFKRKDWISFVRYNHPNMTKRMGGAEAFASFINLQMKQVPATAIKSVSLGKILQVVTTPKDVQCVVEQNMQMELDGVSRSKTTYLIGESLDNGRSWTFFDGSTKTMLFPKDIKPDISDELIIPGVKKDVQ